jgi:pilus assembly protein CpaC
MKTTKYFLLAVSFIFFNANVFGQHEQNNMVEISVEVTEIDNNKANDLGISWPDAIQSGEVAWKVKDRVPEVLPEVPSIIRVGDWARYTPLTATLRLLKESGAAQVLSRPKILAKSGSLAKFLVGGEFPIPVVGPTTTSVEWKEYGVKTEVIPKIDGEYIDMVLKTEVSRLDWANKVVNYPAVLTRHAESSVRVKSGQTITLAGMIETSKQEMDSGIPILSDIPFLGQLFKHKAIREIKNNILIFVTPKIVEY